MYTCVIISIFVVFAACALAIIGVVLDNHTLTDRIALPLMLTGLLFMGVFFIILTL